MSLPSVVLVVAIAANAVAMCEGSPASPFVADVAVQRPGDGVGLDLCPTCLQFSSQAINDLLNVVLNAGVIGTCGEVCGLVEQKTQKNWIGTVCNLLCDVAGVELFINLIDRVDIDPIYYCELIKTCPVNDQGDATITSLAVTPQEGKQGTKFQLDVNWSTVNGTGTGEIYIGIDTVDGIPLVDSFLNEMRAPGDYQTQIGISTKVDHQCDPTQGPCEQWLPGDYTVTFALCNGECGSKHPHSQLYDQKTVTFTISG